VGNYSGEKYLVMDGPDFRRAVLDGDGKIRQDVFDLVWSRLRVLARCSPADKYTIVQGTLFLLDTNMHQAWHRMAEPHGHQ
jgi:magnesium-transporting ATPase (P-type)